VFKWWRKRYIPDVPGRKLTLSDLQRKNRKDNEEAIRSRCFTIVVREDVAITRILGRFKMFVDPGDYSVAVHLMMDGYWEMWLTEELLRIVKAGMVVADIGANLGYFTLIMADVVGSQGHVLAFEPNPRAADLLHRSVHSNGLAAQVSIEQYPLGAISGLPVTLYFDPEQAGGAFVSSVHRDDFSMRIDHMTRRFDDHPRAHEVSFIKIDAEGSEERIWDGMAATVAADVLRIVVLEWCGIRYVSPSSFLDSILSAGFTLAHLDPAAGVMPLDRATLLASPPHQEWLLLLRR
jgi:FkbM family methyltransferase